MAKLRIEKVVHPQRLINYWKKERIVVFLIVIFGLSFNITTVLGPIFQGKLIDAVLGKNKLKEIIILSLIYISIITMIQTLRYFKRFYIRRFANSTSASMRLMIYNNIMNKSSEELEKESAGNLMTRALSDVDLCVEGMRKFTTEIFDTGVLMASYIVSMLIYNVKITLLAIFFVPIAMLLAEKLKTIIYKYTNEYRKKSVKFANITFDTIDNVLLYRANGMEEKNRAKYKQELEELQVKAIKANILENSMQPIYNLIAMLGVAFVIYLGGSKVITGGWSLGIFSTYITMFGALAVKASKAAKLFNSVQKSQVSWKRIKPYLTEYKVKNQDQDLQKENTSLVVSNLSFSFPESRENILENISFQGKSGQIIGITGAIASGKTTLGLSLLGIYPYIGSIKIDGKELNCYSEFERSQMISYLGHKSQLLSDTIYNNIVLGEASEIDSVIRNICFLEDLNSMPEGINTLVGNGGIRLSGGQQSRIALARTLLRKSKIIILDDPFASVDMNTEAKIINNLRKNYKDSLILIISHRLRIFPYVDNIILLNNDKSCIYGNHSELLLKSELYSSIYKLQNATEVDKNE